MCPGTINAFGFLFIYSRLPGSGLRLNGTFNMLGCPKYGGEGFIHHRIFFKRQFHSERLPKYHLQLKKTKKT